jgi:hypothetical protein
MIPVVWSKLADYERHLPFASYVNCQDFDSAQACANHIIEVNGSHQMYDEYHGWRQFFKIRGDRSAFPDLCEYALRNNRAQKEAVDVISLRNVETECISS